MGLVQDIGAEIGGVLDKFAGKVKTTSGVNAGNVGIISAKDSKPEDYQTTSKYRKDARSAIDNDLSTREDQEQIIADSKQRQYAVRDDWTDTEKARAWDKYNQNFAKNGAYGNLNGKTFGNTLNLSRMTDRFNNTSDWKAGLPGTYSRFYGNTTGETGHAERHQPIETQEMRQMRANERIDENARQIQNQLQGRIQAHGFDLQEQADTNRQQIAQQLGISDIQYQTALRNAGIDIEYRGGAVAVTAQKAQRFAQELALEMGTRKGQYVISLFNNPKAGPLLASYMSQLLSGTPGLSIDGVLQNQMIMNAINGSTNPTEAYQTVYYTLYQAQLLGAQQAFAAGAAAFTGKGR